MKTGYFWKFWQQQTQTDSRVYQLRSLYLQTKGLSCDNKQQYSRTRPDTHIIM